MTFFRRRSRIPLTVPENELQCGAACLTSVLRYYNLGQPLASVHEKCAAGRGGVTLREIAQAAKHFGLRTKAGFVDRLDDLQHLKSPAILHWNFEHFVVLERFDGQSAVIVDPSRDRIRVSRSELDDCFTGRMLLLAPPMSPAQEGASTERGSDESSAMLLLRRFVRGSGIGSVLGQVAVASAVLALLGLAVPLMTAVVVDDVLPSGLQSLIGILALGVVAVLIVQIVTTYARAALLSRVQARLDRRLMVGFLEHVLELPFPFFEERSSGDLLQRLSSNVQIRTLLSTQTVSGVLDGALVLIYALVLLAADWRLGLVAVGIGASQAAITLVCWPRMQRLVSRELEEQARAEGFIVEAITGIGSIKASGLQHLFVRQWDAKLTRQVLASVRRTRLASVILALTTSLQRFASLLLLLVGATLVLDQQMSLGTMLGLVALAANFFAPLSSLVSSVLQVVQLWGNIERVASVLRVEREPDASNKPSAPPLRGEVTFSNVSFQHAGTSEWALRDLTLHLEPGQRVGIVGQSGSGKSTLVKLLVGLYRPTSGEIRLDAEPIDSWNPQSVRSQFGVVLQDASVFNGSIRENISNHRADLDLPSVEAAARAACLHDDISRMELGYETRIGEGGTALSGGQKQRLSLARALVQRPRVLILDEATSSLDTETESRITDILRRQECTTVVVAHRLSTIRNADVIVVLAEGRMVECGTHQELMELDGTYARLVRLQDGTSEGNG